MVHAGKPRSKKRRQHQSKSRKGRARTKAENNDGVLLRVCDNKGMVRLWGEPQVPHVDVVVALEECKTLCRCLAQLAGETKTKRTKETSTIMFEV